MAIHRISELGILSGCLVCTSLFWLDTVYIYDTMQFLLLNTSSHLRCALYTGATIEPGNDDCGWTQHARFGSCIVIASHHHPSDLLRDVLQWPTAAQHDHGWFLRFSGYVSRVITTSTRPMKWKCCSLCTVQTKELVDWCTAEGARIVEYESTYVEVNPHLRTRTRHINIWAIYISKINFCHWEHLRVVGPESQDGQIPELTGWMQWSSGEPGSGWEYRRQPWEHQPQRRSTNHNPGNIWMRQRQSWQFQPEAWEHSQHTWEHLQSQSSSLGNATSCLGTLLVRLVITATTYHSTIFKTHVFSVYSQLCSYVTMYLCIYVSMYLWIYMATQLHIVYLDWQQAVLERN